MRLWAILPDEPLTDDRAYLLGNLKRAFDEVESSFVSRSALRFPEPAQRPDLILNLAGGRSTALLNSLDRKAAEWRVPISPPGIAAAKADDKRSYIVDFSDLSPPTRIARSPEDLKKALTDFGQMVVKDPFGMRGIGVERIMSEAELPLACELLANTTCDLNEVVVQPYLSDFAKGDKRVIVQRTPENRFEILGQIFRKPPPGEWKSNLRSGGKAIRTELSEDESVLALEIARRTGLDNVTLDIGKSGGQLFYIEHNQAYGGLIDFDLDRGTSFVSRCADFLLHLARNGRPS
jgi:glutathione synthase/RimK-type ligase-like ATP-grasp enzyme